MRAGEGEGYFIALNFRREESLVEALSAVKGIRAVVDGEVVGYAVDGEASVSNAVSVSSDGCAEAAGIGEVFCEGVVAESNVAEAAVFVEDVDLGDSAAKFGDGSGLAESVSEGVVEDFAAFWGNAEERFSDGHDVMLLYVEMGC